MPDHSFSRNWNCWMLDLDATPSPVLETTNTPADLPCVESPYPLLPPRLGHSGAFVATPPDATNKTLTLFLFCASICFWPTGRPVPTLLGQAAFSDLEGLFSKR